MNPFLSELQEHAQQNFVLLYENLQKPNFRSHYVVLSGIFCSGVSLFSSISPIHGWTFIHVAILVDQVAAPLVASFLENYRNYPLVPYIGHFTHIMLSAQVANYVSSIFYHILIAKQIYFLGIMYLISNYLADQIDFTNANQRTTSIPPHPVKQLPKPPTPSQAFKLP